MRAYPGDVGLLFAVTIPGLAVALVVVAAVDLVLRRRRGRRLPDGRPTTGATGIDEFGALLYAGKRMELDNRASVALLREEDDAGGPPRVDPATGRVRIRVPRAD